MFGDGIKYKCRLCWRFIIDVSDHEQIGKTPVVVQEEEKKDNEVEEDGTQEVELQQDFHDMTLLSFPCRNQKAKIDE